MSLLAKLRHTLTGCYGRLIYLDGYFKVPLDPSQLGFAWVKCDVCGKKVGYHKVTSTPTGEESIRYLTEWDDRLYQKCFDLERAKK